MLNSAYLFARQIQNKRLKVQHKRFNFESGQFYGGYRQERRRYSEPHYYPPEPQYPIPRYAEQPRYQEPRQFYGEYEHQGYRSYASHRNYSTEQLQSQNQPQYPPQHQHIPTMPHNQSGFYPIQEQAREDRPGAKQEPARKSKPQHKRGSNKQDASPKHTGSQGHRVRAPASAPSALQQHNSAALNLSTAEIQKQMIGAKLHYNVSKIDKDYAGAVTSRLMERLESDEVRHLLGCPEALEAKVHEVLQEVKEKPVLPPIEALQGGYEFDSNLRAMPGGSPQLAPKRQGNVAGLPTGASLRSETPEDDMIDEHLFEAHQADSGLPDDSQDKKMHAKTPSPSPLANLKDIGESLPDSEK